jgi:ApaG protein
MPAPAMSDITTHGFRVGATAFYLAEESEPDQGEYYFGYRIVILNDGDRSARLLGRHWDIIDGDGRLKEVDGDGVVGETPHFPPGQAFKYTSFTQLATPWGTMEGHYLMEDDDGQRFRIAIDRFYLTPDAHEVHDPQATLVSDDV